MIRFLKNNGLHGYVYWDHVKTASEASHFIHDLFCSGDYSGCGVQVANRKVLLDDTDLCERLGIELLTESYSTESLLFPIAALQDPELSEIFKRLESYPCLDDDLMSEVERELETECWDIFGRRDFGHHLQKLSDSLVDSDISAEFIEDLSNDQLDTIYYSCCHVTNYDVFEVEYGTSGYFDFKNFGGIGQKSIELFKAELIKLKLNQ